MLMPRRTERISRPEANPLMASLAAAGLCTYHWRIGADAISWSPNAESVLGAASEAIATGRNFAGLLDPGNVTSRFEAVMRSASRDMGEGVAFRIEYLLRPQGRQSTEAIWVEDHGRWYAGPDGKPAEVMGVLRRIDERQKREQSLRYLGNFDPLTGMMNRGRFSEALGEAIASARAKGKASGLLIVSISNIESINEAYGYETAEETIVATDSGVKMLTIDSDLPACEVNGRTRAFLLQK